MNRETAVAEVQQILGWRSDKVTEIRAALSYSQTEREKPGMTFPWWLLKEDQSLAVVAATQTVALPTDYIQDYEEREGNLRYRSLASTMTRTVFLQKMSFEQAEQHYFGVFNNDQDQDTINSVDALSPGVPKAYVLRKASIKVYPIPDQNYTLTWSYWGADVAQADGAANGWLTNAPWVLIGDAAKKLGSDLGNANAVTTATALLAIAESNMFRSVLHRPIAGRNFRMGSKL